VSALLNVHGSVSASTQRESALCLRYATPADVPQLVELNKLAYPVLARENVVWSAAQLSTHQRIFPEGQLVAEQAGHIVGAAATLVVDLGAEPLRHHTWSEVTGAGHFTTHDAAADTLYGADVYVDPRARGQGVGAALYAARRQLCRNLGKRRILAGGRLWNFSENGSGMTAAQYAARVVAGELRDLVLSFQLREGFALRGVMPNYLRDARSHHWASLLEWLNPDYGASPRTPRQVLELSGADV